MLGSLHSPLPKLQERSVQVDPKSGRSTFKLPSSIRLDFAEAPQLGVTNTTRSSFLPAAFDDASYFGQSDYSSESQFKYISGSTGHKLSPRAEALQKNVEMRTFITGSRYIGKFNQLGMTGKGIYKYAHGTIYDGYFNKEGEFHGTGTLVYPGGQRVEGIWKNGKLVSTGANFVASDNSKFDSSYCKMPDRRFQIELDNDVQPAGQEYLTNAETAREVPPGMYDTGYGFYDPQRKVVIKYQDVKQYNNLFDAMEDDRKILYDTLETPIENEHLLVDLIKIKLMPDNIRRIVGIPHGEKDKWVKTHCRKDRTENVGYRPDLYEVWDAGYSRDHFQVLRQLSKFSHSKADALIRKFSANKQKPSDLFSFTTTKVELQPNTVRDLILSVEHQNDKKKRTRKKVKVRSWTASEDEPIVKK